MAATETVGETRTLLATLTGIPREHVRHYAIVVMASDGMILKFCCDDRSMAAALLMAGARAVVTQPGQSLRADGEVPPMPTSACQRCGSREGGICRCNE